MKKVAVIGAGVSGIACCRQLSLRPDLYEFVIYEKSPEIGGTWMYTEKTGQDEFGIDIHSSMYKNLRTNVPKEVMTFHDFPFHEKFPHLPSFVRHEEIKKYLESYVDNFELRKYIKLNTLVKQVKPLILDNGKHLWNVNIVNLLESRDNINNTEEVMQFDAVIVCNGHFAVPKIPYVRGQEVFNGKLLHSHNYRHPEDFSGQNVVLLGAGLSGKDISLDLSSHAKHIFLSHKGPRLVSKLPKNVTQSPLIEQLKGDKVIFQNGNTVPCDALIFCTGYKYSFPFFENSFQLRIISHQVTPLYKSIVHTHFPSLGFIGVGHTVCNFSMIWCQSRYFLAILNGQVKLPSQRIMELEVKRELQRKKADNYRNYHEDLSWEYFDELCETANVPKLPMYIKDITESVYKRRDKDLCHFKNDNFKIITENKWSSSFS